MELLLAFCYHKGQKNQSLMLYHRGEIKAKQDGASKIRNITKL